ncbi:MAG: hypothetical protein H7176_08105 [Bdellovibrionales bacterium]|nr:hypothetical protein [Massilia sp.]
MVQTIGSNSAASPYSNGAPAFAMLQAQLQRYEQQLSDCVNCASAKTSKGQRDIDTINARIAQLKARMEQADDAQKPTQSNAPRSPDGVGGRIDVYA